MSGAWDKVVSCDTWNGICDFIETYYNGFRAVHDDFDLPVPKDYQAAFQDVHGNVYVIYELQRRWPLYYPDIGEDYTDDHREYMRKKYYEDHYGYYGYRIDDDDEYCYDDPMDGPSPAMQREFRRMIEKPDFVFYYIQHVFPCPDDYADRKNTWYVGALHGFQLCRD